MTEFGIFANVKTAYRHVGEGQDVILLHGWGQNMEMMEQIEKHLASTFSVYNLDFPGFGESGLPPVAWDVCDYQKFLEDFVKQNGIVNPILIAHSFGCRVAIRYSALHPEVKKMVLTGAAGIKPEKTMTQQMKVMTYKAGKWFLKATGNEKKLQELQNKSGSVDYRNAQGVMRETFVKVVNDDIRPLLKEIQCPVLLVWGEYDEAVPLEMGKIMEREIPDAGLAIFERDNHFAYWNQSERFNRVLDAFLLEEKQ